MRSAKIQSKHSMIRLLTSNGLSVCSEHCDFGAERVISTLMSDRRQFARALTCCVLKERQERAFDEWNLSRELAFASYVIKACPFTRPSPHVVWLETERRSIMHSTLPFCRDVCTSRRRL